MKKEAADELKEASKVTETETKPERDFDDDNVKTLDKCESKVPAPVVELEGKSSFAQVERRHKKDKNVKKTKKDQEAEKQAEEDEPLAEKESR